MKNFLKKNKDNVLGRSVRKTRCSWRIFSNKVEDAGEILEHAIARTIRVTGRIKMMNLIKLLTFLCVIYVFLFAVLSKNARSGLVFAHDSMDFGIVFAGFIVLGANILYTLWQAYLTLRYKNYEPEPDEKLPACVVIVPAFNEGKQVYPSLMSILKSDYPAEKFEVVTVNDGSTDDTLEWMNKAAADSNGKIQVINLPENKGKRNAIYQGVLYSDAEIFVTVDSDSELLPETLRNLVSPFVTDQKIGGVAGNIRVLNLNDGLIPHMLDVSFVFGFEFTRSAQSRIRTVFCTPGALSAYRRDFLLPLLPGWVDEKFLGKPANIGEDRGISNLILKNGYDVVYQRNSVAFTKVPVTYTELCRMFIRWARSNFRENFSMMTFAFKKFTWNWIGLQINLIMQFVWMFTPMIFIVTAAYCIVQDALAFFYSVITVIMLWSTIPAFFYACRYSKNESLWSYVYGLFNFFALFWIAPYALITIQQSGWLTREAKKKK
ncbi:MAG: glycosyltransferase family 2 protein [Lentisphaeria bacterium]|nr:glycosyltransferase family 2 protein [Lentisphaeria bacterium]